MPISWNRAWQVCRGCLSRTSLRLPLYFLSLLIVTVFVPIFILCTRFMLSISFFTPLRCLFLFLMIAVTWLSSLHQASIGWDLSGCVAWEHLVYQGNHMHHDRRSGLSWHLLQVEGNAGKSLDFPFSSHFFIGPCGFCFGVKHNTPPASDRGSHFHSISFLFFIPIATLLSALFQFDLIYFPSFWMETDFLCGGTEGLLDRTRNGCRSAGRGLVDVYQ